MSTCMIFGLEILAVVVVVFTRQAQLALLHYILSSHNHDLLHNTDNSPLGRMGR